MINLRHKHHVFLSENPEKVLSGVTGHDGLSPWVSGILYVSIGAGIHEEHQPEGQVRQGIDASGSTKANLLKK